jgi:hypothetical protein
MRRYVWMWFAGGAIFFHGGFAMAQNSLDTLLQELTDAKQQHQDVTAQVLSNFFSQIDPAMDSPDTAIALYVQARSAQPNFVPPDIDQTNESPLLDSLLACGIPPTPVATQHEEESLTEKEARLAIDQANLARLAAVLQLHCGLMHYAALFVVKPDQKGLQNDWVAWLTSAAQIYPQTSVPAVPADQNPKPSKKKKGDEDGPAVLIRPPPFDPAGMKGKALRDSVISKFLGFKAWPDTGLNAGNASGSSFDSKDPGGWSVKDLPKLYRTNVLEPLRASPTTATLAAWDAYIAMANADEKDNDQWNQVDYPPLQFDRACDDYAIAPDTEKLEGLVNLIKANPTNPHADEWITRVHQLLTDYRAQHGGNAPDAQNPATPAPSVPAANPNVSVTTEQQGDATIITTHTNSAPTNAQPGQ